MVLVLAVAAVVAAVVAVNARDTTKKDTGTAATPANRYDAAFGSFEPVTVSGTGSDTVSLPASLAAKARGGIITVTYRAAGRFDVSLGDGPALVMADRGGLMAGTVALRGPYGGSFLFGDRFSPNEPGHSDAADQPWTLRIWSESDSKAPWRVTFAPISSARELRAMASGSGDEVFIYNGDFAQLDLRQRPPGKIFGMAQWDLESRNGGMPRGSSAYVFPGPAVVVVSSSGPWSATLH